MQPHWVDLPDDQPFYLAPLGDIQWNGHEDEIAFDELKRHIERAMDLHAWFIGMGDYIDAASPTGRQKIDAAGLYENLRQTIDDRAMELTLQVSTLLTPTRGRWLGMLTGHHYWVFKAGLTSDQRLCEHLEAKYLGDDLGEMGGGMIHLTMPMPHRGSRHINVWCHHGSGSGEESAMLLKLKRIAADWENVHLFLMGHMTKMVGSVVPKLDPVFTPGHEGNPYSFRVIERRVPVVGTGGWSKGILVGRSTYVEKKPGTMRPVCLGAPLIKVTPEFRRSHTRSEDVERWVPRIEVILS